MFNRKTAEDFFSSFLTSADEKITIRFIKDRDKTGNIFEDASAGKCGTVAELLPAIKAKNAKTWGAFFVVNHTGTIGTKDADVTHARALFIDIDDAPCPAFFPVQPSAILRRSDGTGFHVYWFLSEPETDLKRWTAAQKSLIQYYKADKVIHNPARVMRIPGTVNHKEKYVSPIHYEIAEISGVRYTLADVLTGHVGEDKRLADARRRIAEVFKDGEISDGDGRHKAFVSVAFILHDFGFSGSAALAELQRANEKYLKSTYTDQELSQFLASQVYAKNEKGAKTVDKMLVEQAKVDRIKELIKDWYYVRQQDLFFQEGAALPVTSTGFNAKFSYAADMANPTRFVFMHDAIKQYESLVYDPAEDTDIIVKGGIDRNMYIPPEVEPVDTTPDWFLNHIAYLMPEKTEREHFLNYLAYLIQNPGKKVMHGVLIIGRQGIGKSILQRVFSQIFGDSNVCAPHNENLSGAFTGWAKHCQIVVINELMQVDKKDFNNKIKPFITEPTVEVREMYKAPYTIKNCMNIVAFSNHENAIYVDKDDRRWFIVQSPALKKSPEYYDALIDAMENRSGEVMYYLKHRDVSAFRPGAEPPMTEAKQTIIGYSVSDLESWIKEAIESGAAPCESDLVTLEDLREGLPRHLNNGYATANRIGKILKDLGAVPLKDRIRAGGLRRRFWVVRNYEKYQSVGEVRNAITEIYGAEKKDEFVQ